MKLLLPTTICLLTLLAAAPARADAPPCNVHTGTVLDPCTLQGYGPKVGSNADGRTSPTTPSTTATSTSTTPPPQNGAAAAQGYASSVSTMTGTTYDSQGHVQKQQSKMTTSGSSASRETGTMDILEALLILPFNPGRAAKLLLSGEQAHDAATGLDAVTAKAEKYNELMQGPGNLGTTANANPQGSGGANGQSGNPSGASSNPAASGRAGELYGQLEEKYGMGRSDFENEVNRVKGDPEAVGTFMQEATGDKAIGKEAVSAALDAYALELGMTRAELRTSHLPAATEFSVSAPSSGPSAPSAAPSQPKPDAGAAEAERKLASAKEKEKKESLRDKLKKALADRQSGRPSEESFEKLEPIRDQFFDKLKAEQEKELSLFEVVRAKYLEKREMLERAPGAPTQ